MKAILGLLLLVFVSSRVTWVSNEEFNEVILKGNNIIDIAKCVLKSKEVKKVVDDVLVLIRTGKLDYSVLTDALAAYSAVKQCIAGPKVTSFEEHTTEKVCEIKCKRIGEDNRKCTKICKQAPKKIKN